MKTVYFLLVIYFALALFQAVNDNKSATRFQKLVNFIRAAVFPATWVYDTVKALISYIK